MCVCVCMCCPSNVGPHLFWENKFCGVRMWTWRDMYRHGGICIHIHIWYKHSITNTGTTGNNWMEHQVNLCTIRNCDSLWFQLPANHNRGWHDIEISKIDQEWFQRQLLDGPYPQFRSNSTIFVNDTTMGVLYIYTSISYESYLLKDCYRYCPLVI